MQKKLLAVAVLGALAAPTAAMAQVTVSGAINMWYEQAGATGATNVVPAGVTSPSTYDVKSRDRMQDGAGSNIRFTAVEDIGSNMQGFMQVESGVMNNANTRPDAVGNGAAPGGWANRNSGVGLRGASWGEFLIGVWDIHYNESYAVDNQLLKGPSHSSSLGLLGQFGTVGVVGTTATAASTPVGTIGALGIGTRYSNVMRYQSPSWGGFTFKVSYARPTDGVVSTAGTINDGTKNKVISFSPSWSNGPIYVGWSYLKDSDISTTAGTSQVAYNGATVSHVTTSAAPAGFTTTGIAASLWTVTSSRLQGAYTFPFGLKLGLILDSSKLEGKSTTGIVTANTQSNTELKRNVWSIPISWNTGAHTIFGTYAVAQKVKGSVNNADVSNIQVAPAGMAAGTTQDTVGEKSGAKFYSLGYQFDLSKRTNVHVNYSQIKNDNLAGYDFFSNTAGMSNMNYGADPRIISLGLRHAF
jgi:predicted porin